MIEQLLSRLLGSYHVERVSNDLDPFHSLMTGIYLLWQNVTQVAMLGLFQAWTSCSQTSSAAEEALPRLPSISYFS